MAPAALSAAARPALRRLRRAGLPPARRWPPLLYGGGAFLLVHGVFILTPFRSVLPLALPFIALVLWGTLFFQWWPWSEGGRRRGVERGFFLSMLAAGLYVVACLAFGALLFRLGGPPLQGGG